MASKHRQRGFTLLEALMATSILLGIVTAVTTAVVSGQQNAFEANQRVAGILAAESMMSRLDVIPYTAIDTMNGVVETPGKMTDDAGDPLPPMYGTIGRSVSVLTQLKAMTNPSVTIAGKSVVVRTFTPEGRTLTNLERFFAEPQAP